MPRNMSDPKCDRLWGKHPRLSHNKHHSVQCWKSDVLLVYRQRWSLDIPCWILDFSARVPSPQKTMK